VTWRDSPRAYRCDHCGFEIFIPIAETDEAALGLYDDDRFPGRCLLVLKSHFEHLDEIPEHLASSFLLQAMDTGRVLRTSGLGPRVNYAVLGNEHPHVHYHIIPRQSASDAIPRRPVWEHPLKARKLSSSARKRVIGEIRDALLSG
jgi:diadenosine tetraphosphate (Ap4A) HIT family hydrolase